MNIEPAWTRSTGIHDEPRVFAVHERTVCVAKDDDVGVVRLEEHCRRRTAELVAMADVNAHPVHLESQHFRQGWIGGIIDVPVNGLHRRELAQLVENARSADVSCVNDQVNAAQRRDGFWSKQVVCVGDEAYDHGWGVE